MRMKIKCLNQKINYLKEDSFDLLDGQSDEIGQLVEEISESETGKAVLEKLYNEADETEEGRGEILQSIWNNDAKFINDQINNGKFSSRIIIIIFYFIYSNWKMQQQMVNHNSFR